CRLWVTVVDRFVLGWGQVAAGGVQPSVVEPVEVLQGGQLEVVDAAPGPVAADQLCLVQAVERLSEGVVVGISFAANGRDRASVAEAFGVADRQVLPPP